jgi:hypothetical protein
MEEFDIDTRLAYTLLGIAFGFQFNVEGSRIQNQGTGIRA